MLKAREEGGGPCHGSREQPARHHPVDEHADVADLALSSWGGLDSNQRPTDYESAALTN